VNRGSSRSFIWHTIGVWTQTIFFYFSEISGFTFSYTSEPLSFGYVLDHFNEIIFFYIFDKWLSQVLSLPLRDLITPLVGPGVFFYKKIMM
jgi:hypothetical protein